MLELILAGGALLLSEEQEAAAQAFRAARGVERFGHASILVEAFPDRLDTRTFAIRPATDEPVVTPEDVENALGSPDRKRPSRNTDRRPTPRGGAVDVDRFERWTYDLGCAESARTDPSGARQPLGELCWELYVLFYDGEVVRAAVVGKRRS